MRRKLLTLLGLALVLAVWALPSQAIIQLAPDADTLLSNDSNRGPTVNHGSSSQWQVRWHEAPRVRIGYVRYDISGIDPSLFNTAYLAGTFTDTGKDGDPAGANWEVYGLWDDVAGNDWDESTVNYSNAAGVDSTAPVGDFLFEDADLLGLLNTAHVEVQPLAFSSNPADLPLESFLLADTDGLVTFMIMDSTMAGTEYYVDSKEGNTADGHGPMNLNFIPEPSTTLLMLGGMGLLGLLRRRK